MGRGVGPRGHRWEEMDAWRILRVFYPVLAQLREIFPRIVELEGGEPAPATLSDHVPLGHGTRRRHLHHKAPRRDDDKAAHGGFGGAEHPQHGAVEGLGNPETAASPSNPSMANRAAMIPLSASLLRLMAKSQSIVVPILHKEQNRNI